MTIPAISMLAFDLFGVIFSEGHLISNVLTRLLPRDVQKLELKKHYAAYNVGEISEAEFWQAIGQQDVTSIRQRFLQQFETDPEFDQVIPQLKQRYRVAILSNLPADWADTLSYKFNFAQVFSPCLFSGHLKCKKPQPEIYQQLLLQSGLKAGQIAFIDDRLENLQTAHELGFITIYYQKDIETHTFQPDFEIQQLSQLLSIMKLSKHTPEEYR